MERISECLSPPIRAAFCVSLVRWTHFAGQLWWRNEFSFYCWLINTLVQGEQYHYSCSKVYNESIALSTERGVKYLFVDRLPCQAVIRKTAPRKFSTSQTITLALRQ